MIFGELIIKDNLITMLHGNTVFGTARQTGIGIRESWLIHVPSLNFAATERSKAIAENVLVACYCQSDRT